MIHQKKNKPNIGKNAKRLKVYAILSIANIFSSQDRVESYTKKTLNSLKISKFFYIRYIQLGYSTNLNAAVELYGGTEQTHAEHTEPGGINHTI